MIASLSQTLNDPEAPLALRFRALFALKDIKTDKSVRAIGPAFNDKSILLKHEVAYVLGQIKLKSAIPILTAVLSNLNEDQMVRHEVI
jgi:deoxyhypusine monooxygenase